MMSSSSLCGIVLLCMLWSMTHAADAVSYRAASVMHTPYNITYGITVQQMLMDNLRAYEAYAQSAASQNADLILFPESGTGFLQVPTNYLRLFCEVPVPLQWEETNCTHPTQTATPHVSWASCAAKKYNLDVVINFCLNDTTTGEFFNVDAAFWKDGTLRSVYRKSHITGTGPYLDQPTTPDAVTFTSSFNVTFGMFTCYDFWFTEPQSKEMRSMGVTDFLFPSEMGSGNPYFLVPMVQNGWSLSNQVNLIGSTSFGNGGAGAYSQGTTLGMVQMFPLNMTNAHGVVVSTLPRLTPSDREASYDRSSRMLRAKQLASESAQKTTVKVIPTSVCVYGPPINGLNFTFPCAIIPQPVAGVTYQLEAASQVSDDPYSGVLCTANVTTSSNSSMTWILGAIAITRAPSVSTPSTNNNGMCVFSQCLHPSQGCMLDNPAAGWYTDLKVSEFSLRMQTTGQLANRTMMVMPSAGLSNGGVSSAATDATNSLRWSLYNLGSDEMTFMREPNHTFWITGSDMWSDAMKTMEFYSAGFYATSDFATLQGVTHQKKLL